MLLAAINRLPVQGRRECTPQDNHIGRRGRGNCSPGKAGTKAQDLLLAQFLGCNHPTPPPHERSIRDCQEYSKEPIKLALGAHTEEACASRESLYSLQLPIMFSWEKTSREKENNAQSSKEYKASALLPQIHGAGSFLEERTQQWFVTVRNGRHKVQTQQDAAEWELLEESDCMEATSWPQHCEAASPSQQTHWSHTSHSESASEHASAGPKSWPLVSLHSVPAPAQAAMLQEGGGQQHSHGPDRHISSCRRASSQLH